MILDRQYLETFDNLPALKEIYLDNNQITNIASGTFNNLPALEVIFLNDNQITNIAPGTFNNLSALEEIDLRDNQIKNIAPRAFDNLLALKLVLLDNNQITNISPGTFNNLPVLEHIYLRDNQITNIDPGAFDNLPVLEIISLDNNQITNIAQGTFDNLPALQSILLSNNPIINFDNIPTNVNIVSNNNQIIHNTVLNKLNEGYINCNKITSIYDIISSYNNLRTLKNLYPKQNEIILLFSVNTPHIRDIAKRIQLLANIASLKLLPYHKLEDKLKADKLIKDTNKKSNAELKQTIAELKTVNNRNSNPEQSKIKKLSGIEKLPDEIGHEIASYLGGSNNTYNNKIYKDKYIKYKNKYLELKKKLIIK